MIPQASTPVNRLAGVGIAIRTVGFSAPVKCCQPRLPTRTSIPPMPTHRMVIRRVLAEAIPVTDRGKAFCHSRITEGATSIVPYSMPNNARKAPTK
jgi:hypothetical protein